MQILLLMNENCTLNFEFEFIVQVSLFDRNLLQLFNKKKIDRF